MKKANFLISLLTLFTISCSKEKSDSQNNTGSGFLNNSLKSIKSGANSVKDYVVEPDSIKTKKKADYVKHMLATYPEFKKVSNFFNTRSPYILEPNGKFYRIIDLKITDNGTVIHKYETNPNEVKYFYDGDNNFYIYTFNDENGTLKSTNIRRIKKGRFSQPVHDLIFEGNQLVREDYVSDVTKAFYEKDDKQFFEIETKTDDGNVSNLFNLGQKQDF